MQFPELFEGPALGLVHHATQQLDDLVSSLFQHFSNTFTPGEEAVALRGGFPASCIVVQEVPEGLPALQPGTAGKELRTRGCSRHVMRLLQAVADS